MSWNTENYVWAIKEAIGHLTDEKMRSGALSFLPAGGAECEEKVKTALKILQEAYSHWGDDLSEVMTPSVAEHYK